VQDVLRQFEEIADALVVDLNPVVGADHDEALIHRLESGTSTALASFVPTARSGWWPFTGSANTMRRAASSRSSASASMLIHRLESGPHCLAGLAQALLGAGHAGDIEADAEDRDEAARLIVFADPVNGHHPS
jgi:hypothetical protein